MQKTNICMLINVHHAYIYASCAVLMFIMAIDNDLVPIFSNGKKKYLDRHESPLISENVKKIKVCRPKLG